MDAIVSQITSRFFYSTVYSDADQRKHQSSASLAFVWRIHQLPVNSPHKWPETRKMFPLDDVIMCNFWDEHSEIDISSLLNAILATDPNNDYEKFKKYYHQNNDKHRPEKCVYFNKCKHKRSNWITSGILKSIEFRDKLYKCLKMYFSENGEYELWKYNLKI